MSINEIKGNLSFLKGYVRVFDKIHTDALTKYITNIEQALSKQTDTEIPCESCGKKITIHDPVVLCENCTPKCQC